VRTIHTYRVLLALFLLVPYLPALLGGCAGMPIGPDETLAISQQATFVGVASVKAGLEPLAKVLENPTGSQILFWPGARNGSEILWNMACLVRCQSGWQNETLHYIASNGRTMAAAKASSFTQELIDSGYWRVVPMTPTAIAQMAASVSMAVGSNWYSIVVAPALPAMLESGPALDGPQL
jgi:hypothetical protein